MTVLEASVRGLETMLWLLAFVALRTIETS